MAIQRIGLTGGIGSDVFKWELADRGAKGAPAIDTVTDFSTALPGAGSSPAAASTYSA